MAKPFASYITALSGLLLLVATACETPDPSSKPTDSRTDDGTKPNNTQTPNPSITQLEERKSDKARVTPNLSAEEKDQLRDGNQNLSFELLRNSGKPDGENVAVSAVSMRTAFGMVHAMARGKTRNEIANGLHLFSDPAKTQAGINEVDRTILSRNLAKTTHQDPVIVSTANRMFVKKGLEPGVEFLDTLAQNYGAGVYQTDFNQNARQAINNWVSEKTHEKILDLLPPSSINVTTQWVLINAMYLRAPWAASTQKGGKMSFTKTDGNVVSVDAIDSPEVPGHYGSQPDFDWVQLPLRGDNLGAMIIMPKAGKFSAVQSAMSAKIIGKMKAEQKNGSVGVQMPSFKIKTGTMDYSKYIHKKMPTLFNAALADFGGFGDLGLDAIDFVYHSVFLAADENGVEAAAATAVGNEEKGPSIDHFMRVDRPFLFLVYDNPSGLVLFAGRVMNPLV